MRVRPEAEADYTAIRLVNESAFETPAEADLVEELRKKQAPLVSLVANAAWRP